MTLCDFELPVVVFCLADELTGNYQGKQISQEMDGVPRRTCGPEISKCERRLRGRTGRRMSTIQL